MPAAGGGAPPGRVDAAAAVAVTFAPAVASEAAADATDAAAAIAAAAATTATVFLAVAAAGAATPPRQQHRLSRPRAAAAGDGPALPLPPEVGCPQGALRRAWGLTQRGSGNPLPAARRLASTCPASAASHESPRSPIPSGRLPAVYGGHLGGRRCRSVSHAPHPLAAAAERWAPSRRLRCGDACRVYHPPPAAPQRLCVQQRRAAAATAARACVHSRRRLGAGAAVRSVTLPTAVPVRGVKDLPVAAPGWQHVVTAGGGGRRPPQSPRCVAPSVGSRLQWRWRRGNCSGLQWWPCCGTREGGMDGRGRCCHRTPSKNEAENC